MAFLNKNIKLFNEANQNFINNVKLLEDVTLKSEVVVLELNNKTKDNYNKLKSLIDSGEILANDISFFTDIGNEVVSRLDKALDHGKKIEDNLRSLQNTNFTPSKPSHLDLIASKIIPTKEENIDSLKIEPMLKSISSIITSINKQEDESIYIKNPANEIYISHKDELLHKLNTIKLNKQYLHNSTKQSAI